MYVSIRIQGHLDPSWQTFLEDLHITHEPDGTTLLSGSLPDQSALQGVLSRLGHLSLALLSLEASDILSDGA
jgi:hypothetical protein